MPRWRLFEHSVDRLHETDDVAIYLLNPFAVQKRATNSEPVPRSPLLHSLTPRRLWQYHSPLSFVHCHGLITSDAHVVTDYPYFSFTVYQLLLVTLSNVSRPKFRWLALDLIIAHVERQQLGCHESRRIPSNASKTIKTDMAATAAPHLVQTAEWRDGKSNKI